MNAQAKIKETGGCMTMTTKITSKTLSGDAHREFDLGGFTRHLAHEIANPLNAIMMNAEMAKALIGRGEKVRAEEALERLLDDCTRCAKLMRGMQHFGAGMAAQEASPVSLRELIEGATSSIVFEYEGALPSFVVDATDTPITLDRAAVERSLIALLRNAAEAGATEVSIHGRKEKNDFIIELCDNGNGLDEKGIERISTSFHSSKRAAGALGLGVAMARELVRKQNGSLSIRANSPKGLIVCLTFHAPRG